YVAGPPQARTPASAIPVPPAGGFRYFWKLGAAAGAARHPKVPWEWNLAAPGAPCLRRQRGDGHDVESGQDVLLTTKLHVPRPQPGLVARPRLAEALGEGLARGRVLVCAPAGFGKSALLADWARGAGRPVAWLGLDGGDSDPARFWRYVVFALDR